MSDLPTPVQRVVEDASARGLQIPLLKATGARVEDLHQDGAEEGSGWPSKTYPGRV